MIVSQIENNCQALLNYLELPYLGLHANRENELVHNPNWVAKIIFWLKDIWTRGAETEKVNQIVLETLKAMRTHVINCALLNEEYPICFFQARPINPPLNSYQRGYTYAELAGKILNSVRFKESQPICQEAETIKSTWCPIVSRVGLQIMLADAEKLDKYVLKSLTRPSIYVPFSLEKRKKDIKFYIERAKIMAAFGKIWNYETECYDFLQHKDYNVSEETMKQYRIDASHWTLYMSKDAAAP